MDRVQRLRTVVAAAQRHPVYAEKLRQVDVDALTPEGLTRLPLTTRQDWLAYLQANPRPPQGAALMHLTPSPAMGWMPEYLSAEDVAYQAEALAAQMRRLGVAGKRVLVAFGYHVFAGGWLFHEALQRAGAMVLPHGPGEAERIAQLQRQYGFEVLVSNPSFAMKVAQAGGRFELLMAGGEPFTSVPGYRERLEQAIGGVAVDAYGTSELGVVAGEGLEKDGLWEIPEMAVLEVIDPETLEPTPEGEKGELVVTSLSRTLMPMIRFRTGDLAVVSRRGGRVCLPKGVIGRTDLMVKVKGVKLYPTELAPLLMAFGIDPRGGAQVVVETKEGGTDRLILRIKAESVPPQLGPALQQATGIRIDEIQADPALEGPPLVDRRY
ncbi:MAG: phenylacetate--CoA ligase family protein [Meiothermus sp.]|uniref:phenylacetate--CoA ligase family protein n=1 Tax=Meiothermus sp. TaxID=1955249 RepID=UPI002600A7F0|nr:AMP-binding protein [Meiothermus sp.]MCS7057562.1 phenylacetate--CoA ligase family protein [Meiothermus sp.]MCS7195208.1 phenylacetate--CoA ligase family protein [Meiothermus sp.]MCX7741125.1 phenylacetate--CoA ligase family protein [Meiothermus sp.]MDW8482377.1 phenylacetate--CoA ligase family protein [Meiothermus sp.]